MGKGRRADIVILAVLAAASGGARATGLPSWLVPYASVRLQAEAVRPADARQVGDYAGLRDAYSRFGVRGERDLGGGLAMLGQAEFALDLANGRARDPYDREESRRVLRLGLRGPLGSIVAGQQWLPYYDAVSSAVDRFSTYYSGFATYTTPRVRDTVAYESPQAGGIAVAAAWSHARGNRRSTARIDDRRLQASIRGELGRIRVAVAVDDRGNAAGYRDRLHGLSASWDGGDLHVAAKYEVTSARDPRAFFGNGARTANVFASWTSGPDTLKAMAARVENFGGTIVHLGWERRLGRSAAAFAEYYREGETAAIAPRREGLRGFDASLGGGWALAAGVRVDF
ncbi:MAG: porin [Burkholderiales bacterium]|nr:porin [Burkholderiales bacterium]